MSDEIDFSKIESEIKFNSPGILEDPKPKTKATKSAPRSTNARGPGRPSKTSAIKEMQEEIEGFLMMIAMPLKMRDHHPDGSSCADMFVDFDNGKLTDEAKTWAEAFATIGVDNKVIKNFFDMGDGVAKWAKLFFASQPFVMGMIWSHGPG